MNEEMSENYLRRMNDLMEKRFISKKEMANRLGIEYLTFWRKLNGKRSIDVALLKKNCRSVEHNCRLSYGRDRQPRAGKNADKSSY